MRAQEKPAARAGLNQSLLRERGKLAVAGPPWRAVLNRTGTRPATKSVTGGDGTAVRLSAPGAVRHDVAHKIAHVVLQIPDDVFYNISDRDHAYDLAGIQHWQMAKTALSHHCHAVF